jgi:tetratricopeptide (TPR) repeat protein
VAWTRRALALLGEAAPLRRFDLLARLERMADATGDRAEQGLRQAEMDSLLQRHPDDACLARLLVAQSILADHRGDLPASEQLARQANEAALRCHAAEPAAESHCQLAWVLHRRRQFEAATAQIDSGLQCAARVEEASNRAKVEGQLLVLSAKVSISVCRFDEARVALTAALARGELLGAARLQLNSLSGLVDIAASLGHWQDSRAWAERMHAVASATGLRIAAAWAMGAIGRSAARLGHDKAAIGRYEDALANIRAVGERRMELHMLQALLPLHLGLGDVEMASRLCGQARALLVAAPDPLGASAVEAHWARCELLQGRPESALATVNAVLDRLGSELAGEDPAVTIHCRWLCQQVLEALGDERAALLLDALHANVQVSAANLTDPADRERLIQALDDFRGIVAAYALRGGQATAG